MWHGGLVQCRTHQIKLVMAVPTSTRFAWHVAYVIFASVIGDDECRMSRSVDLRRLSTSSGSPGRVVGCEAGRKMFERTHCRCEKYKGTCMKNA